MPRKSYTNKQKLAILNEVEKGIAEGQTLRSLARSFGLQPKQLREWKTKKTTLANARSGAKSIHTGHKSILHEFEEDLLRWFFELREQGMGISVRMMILKASELKADYRRRSARAKDQSMRRFLARHKIAIRAQTHESQRAPAEVRVEALDFVATIRPMLTTENRHHDYILNMDQTPIFFTMTPRTTLNTVGEKTINIRSSTNSTMRATVAVTVSASGKCLPPFLIFKGKPGGRSNQPFVI